MAKRKRVDSGEQEEPVSKPAASTDSETSDSDDEVWRLDFLVFGSTKVFYRVKLYQSPLVVIRVLPLLLFCCDFFETKSDLIIIFFFLSSGLLVAPKAKRRSSKAKGRTKRMPRRRRLIKQRRPAARMEIAQQKARPRRRVSVHGLWGQIPLQRECDWTPLLAIIMCDRIRKMLEFQAAWQSVSWGVDYTDNQDVLCHSLRLGDSLAHPPLYLLEHCAASKLLDRFTSELETWIENFKSFWIRVIF